MMTEHNDHVQNDGMCQVVENGIIYILHYEIHHEIENDYQKL